MASSVTPLQHIDPDRIKKNPDNPRLVFREDEMNQLLESIKNVGIKVPVTVYVDGKRYVLLDGERRWRCARRLNLDRIPAIVQPKPNRLENILMMFNIHNVRVDWDPLPMALKLKEVKRLLEREGKGGGVKELAAVTGLRPASVRRALDLLDLPKKYQRMLLREAAKPRSEQSIKADLFVEVYKSLHAIERHIPEVFDRITKGQYIDAMVAKYLEGVVKSEVSFRQVSRMARAELADVERQSVAPVIVRLVTRKDYSVDEAYAETVRGAYEKRDLVSKLGSLADQLATLRSNVRLDSEMREAMLRLRSEIDRLLG
ncbi:MAG: ParB/RepB/Spo0J family partition protein [Candidatus Acidiferrales bacterium]